MCGAALTNCADEGQGFIAYWRWEATVSRATGDILDPPGWVASPGEYCLGPTDAALPPIAAIGGILATDFQRLLVNKGIVRVEPSGSTLVNYDTGFSTDAGRYELAPTRILGHRVEITANPERYDWYFGDGTSLADAGPGHEGTLDVSHRYTRTGQVGAYVVITWSGRFTVDGGAPQAVFGTAQTTSPATPVQVKQARAELVSR
jgi:hypothetical protein